MESRLVGIAHPVNLAASVFSCATSAEQAARALKKTATLFCIGIGVDVDGGLLQRIASGPEDYWYAQRADEVPQLFGQIVELFLNDDSVDDAGED